MERRSIRADRFLLRRAYTKRCGIREDAVCAFAYERWRNIETRIRYDNRGSGRRGPCSGPWESDKGTYCGTTGWRESGQGRQNLRRPPLGNLYCIGRELSFKMMMEASGRVCTRVPSRSWSSGVDARFLRVDDTVGPRCPGFASLARARFMLR